MFQTAEIQYKYVREECNPYYGNTNEMYGVQYIVVWCMPELLRIENISAFEVNGIIPYILW